MLSVFSVGSVLVFVGETYSRHKGTNFPLVDVQVVETDHVDEMFMSLMARAVGDDGDVAADADRTVSARPNDVGTYSCLDDITETVIAMPDQEFEDVGRLDARPDQ